MLRVAVVDVGSTSAHVDVVELRRSSPPVRPVTVKHKVRLSREVSADGRIREESVPRLARAVEHAARTAARHGAHELLAFVTSVVRDAPNRTAVLDRVAQLTGVRLGFLSPRQEARLTYEGASSWTHTRPGAPLLVADIGGGTVELALGAGPRADRVASAPLGARRLTLARLPGDPPRPRQVARARAYLRQEARALVRALGPLPEGTSCVAASRVFAQLAVASGGDAETPVLSLAALRGLLPVLASATTRERATLPGVSRSRAPHILAGALMAEALMEAAHLTTLPVSPRGLREGITQRLQAGLTHPRTAHDLAHLRQPA